MKKILTYLTAFALATSSLGYGLSKQRSFKEVDLKLHGFSQSPINIDGTIMRAAITVEGEKSLADVGFTEEDRIPFHYTIHGEDSQTKGFGSFRIHKDMLTEKEGELPSSELYFSVEPEHKMALAKSNSLELILGVDDLDKTNNTIRMPNRWYFKILIPPKEMITKRRYWEL